MQAKHLRHEVTKGLQETCKYLLSHHEEKNHSKCYLLSIANKHVAICSRCLGIYPGIVLGLAIVSKVNHHNLYYLIAIIFPLFALAEWSISTFTKINSSNIIRTITGIFLGMAYSVGIFLFFNNFPNYFIIAAGIFYIGITLILLTRKQTIQRIL